MHVLHGGHMYNVSMIRALLNIVATNVLHTTGKDLKLFTLAENSKVDETCKDILPPVQEAKRTNLGDDANFAKYFRGPDLYERGIEI